MKATVLICCILGLALSGLTCTPGDSLLISVAEDALSVSVTDVDGGIVIGNLSTGACIVFVSSHQGEQRFELAAGESVTVTGIARPIEVGVVTLQNQLS